MTRTRAIALVGAAFAAALVPLPRSLVERWYSTWVYPPLQRAITPLSNLVPFALFDGLLIAAACAVALRIYRRVGRDGWKPGLMRSAGGAIVAASVAYLAFVAMWGLNYRRVPLTAKVVFDPAQINRSGARAFGEANASVLNRLYEQAHRGEPSRAALAESFQAALQKMGAGAPIALARPKETLLAGYFHQISVSGMTDPFFLETLIASDLLEVERPFVIAHEWAHLAGYADESEASFIAWLACRHGDAAAQYSGALMMIAYAPPARPLREALDIGPRIDLWAIQRRYAGTNVMLRVAARRGYDSYLRANRVEKGVESYDAVVQLILGTAMDGSGYPRRR